MDSPPIVPPLASPRKAPHGPISVGRLRSLDALRGADMAIILGGREAILGVAALCCSGPSLEAIQRQFEHPEWNGFSAYDLIFPLFLFLAGVSLPLSLGKRLAQGMSKRSLTIHALRRGAVLTGLGVIYNGLLGLDLESLRVASVLGRIGLAWMIAALLWIHLPRRAVALAGVLLAGGHAAALLLITAPGLGLEAPSLAPGETISGWIDRQLLPGRLYKGVRDPEGLFGVLPAAATALLGAMAGTWIHRPDRTAGRRIGGLLAMGGQALVLGWALDRMGLPINKNLWTLSFVLWAGGWSFLLLAIFHWLFDVLRFERIGSALAVIGANSILAYLAGAFISWRAIAELVFSKGLQYGKLHEALLPAAGLLILWILLGALYRRRIFLRV